MPNYHFGVLASPGKHEELKREINQWQYEVEGDKFKGKTTPYLSELKFYEVRIPDDVADQFVKDLPMSFPYYRLGMARNWKMKILFKLYKLCIKYLSPYEFVEEPQHLERKHRFTFDWCYVLPLGKLKRNKVKSKFSDREREVM